MPKSSRPPYLGEFPLSGHPLQSNKRRIKPTRTAVGIFQTALFGGKNVAIRQENNLRWQRNGDNTKT